MQCDIAQAGGVVEKVCGGSKIAEERGKKGRERPVSLSAPGKEGKTVFFWRNKKGKFLLPRCQKVEERRKKRRGAQVRFMASLPLLLSPLRRRLRGWKNQVPTALGRRSRRRLEGLGGEE